MIKLLDLVSILKFCICHQCAQIVSQVAGLGFFFVFKEKSDRSDQVAGLGLQIEILYLSAVCSNSQSSCWTWLFFLFLKRKVTDMIKLLDLVSKLKFCICHQCAQIVSQFAGLGLLFRF